MCPNCKAPRTSIKKKGFYPRVSGQRKRVQRYFCNHCRKTFHIQKKPFERPGNKNHLEDAIFNILCSHVSQRRCAQILNINKVTVARKVNKLGGICRVLNKQTMIDPRFKNTVVFDEMETFSHSKCKPLSIALAVQEKSRKILSVHVSQMPAKGRLAHIALKRYGFRKDKRREGLDRMMGDLALKAMGVELFKSDECPRYPSVVRKHFPGIPHDASHSRRACVVGQGELKAGGFDPLFSLNHTAAMIRDNVKRLARKTWCTTKKEEALQDLLDMYVTYHNKKLEKTFRTVSLEGGPTW